MFIPIVASSNVLKTTFYTVDMEFIVSISLLKLQGPYISQPFVAFLRAQITLRYFPIFFLSIRRFGRLFSFLYLDVFGYHFDRACCLLELHQGSEAQVSALRILQIFLGFSSSLFPETSLNSLSFLSQSNLMSFWMWEIGSFIINSSQLSFFMINFVL